MPSALQCVYQGTNLPTTAGSLYVSPAGTRVTTTKATAVNHSATAGTFSVWILPSGIAATADRYLLIEDRAITPGQTLDVSELRTHTLEPGDAIWAVASANNAIAFRISAQIVT